MRQCMLPMQVGSLTESWPFPDSMFDCGSKMGWLFFWCFEVLDSLLWYDDQFKLQYAAGVSYLNWKKPGLIPKDSKSKDLTPGSHSETTSPFTFTTGWNSPRYFRQADVVHLEAMSLERFCSSFSRWQCLYFFPLPHQQISFLPSLGMASRLPSIFSSNFMWHPIADRDSAVKFTFEEKGGHPMLVTSSCFFIAVLSYSTKSRCPLNPVLDCGSKTEWLFLVLWGLGFSAWIWWWIQIPICNWWELS